MAALFVATITYAPASTAAISNARIVGVWVRLFILESPRFYRSESNAGLPFRITHTAGLDWKFPLPGALVSGPAVPSYVAMLRIYTARSEEHTSELQSHSDLVCRLLLEKKKKKIEQRNQIL